MKRVQKKKKKKNLQQTNLLKNQKMIHLNKFDVLNVNLATKSRTQFEKFNGKLA